MLIGEVAETLGVDRQTIRFYEKQGLLPPPHRQPNGYRDYDPTVISRLNFIQSGQTAGLTLAEITSILSLRDEGEAPCSHASLLLVRKLENVQARQRELAVLAAELQTLIGASQVQDPAECGETDICTIITNPRRA